MTKIVIPADTEVARLRADKASLMEVARVLHDVTIGYQKLTGETLHPMTREQLRRTDNFLKALSGPAPGEGE
jgi:hypothetical protein